MAWNRQSWMDAVGRESTWQGGRVTVLHARSLYLADVDEFRKGAVVPCSSGLPLQDPR